MAVGSISLTVNSTQSVAGPDSLVARASGAPWPGTPAGVGSGGPAILNDFINLFRDMLDGEFIPSFTASNPNVAGIWMMDGITLATQTFTFTGNGTAGDTVTINGQALTAVNSGAGANQWNIGTSTTTAALNLLAAINATTTAIAIRGVCYASIYAPLPAVVVVSSLFGGVIGNLITTAKVSTGITVGGATLTGGASNQPGIFPA